MNNANTSDVTKDTRSLQLARQLITSASADAFSFFGRKGVLTRWCYRIGRLGADSVLFNLGLWAVVGLSGFCICRGLYVWLVNSQSPGLSYIVVFSGTLLIGCILAKAVYQYGATPIPVQSMVKIANIAPSPLLEKLPGAEAFPITHFGFDAACKEVATDMLKDEDQAKLNQQLAALADTRDKQLNALARASEGKRNA